MARSRGRSRGSSLPALGGTLGSLLRSTLAQAGAVKDVLERGAREGKHRLDDARRERRREQALARLGEAVLEAMRAGEAPELLDRADVADAIAEVEDLERGAERDRGDDAWVAPPTRERYDRGDDDGTVSSAGWRPPARPAARPRDDRGSGMAGPAADDRSRPVRRPADEPGARFADRRPADEPGARFADRRPADEPGARFADRRPADEPGARFADRRPADVAAPPRSTPAPAPRPEARPRAGGIQFDREGDDDDLADYMHPDDLLPRPPKGT